MAWIASPMSQTRGCPLFTSPELVATDLRQFLAGLEATRGTYIWRGAPRTISTTSRLKLMSKLLDSLR